MILKSADILFMFRIILATWNDRRKYQISTGRSYYSRNQVIDWISGGYFNFGKLLNNKHLVKLEFHSLL